MKNEIIKIKNEILEALNGIKDEQVLAGIEKKYLGRKGSLTKILRQVADLSGDNRKIIGKFANDTKREIGEKLNELKKALDNSQASDSFIDVTLPGKKIETGRLNPVSIVQNELEDLFKSMGFIILDGPELESDYYNFEALNIPATHPARDMQDTFYVDIKNKKGEYDTVMRTHTSPVQVRAMQKYGAPLRCVVPGRVFRSEAIDACHEHTFDQMEGLMIDENISIANLIAVMKELLKGIFGQEVETRVRPGYFPFVEPGIELDIKCTICGGKGCPACKHSGWLELLPAGMVHPSVLKFGGIDSKIYTGFAFGLGLTRLAMMKYGIDDIRLFNSGDLRFLEQF
ncbi:phenylalanine--tRNA ligase subunit alpha [Candidatus Falkowbacteria bacterium]|nr:MAG: phenylalanine--tRNA ligase subunit alpha [Candidatus Falkowbacteria bacterium]